MSLRSLKLPAGTKVVLRLQILNDENILADGELHLEETRSFSLDSGGTALQRGVYELFVKLAQCALATPALDKSDENP